MKAREDAEAAKKVAFFVVDKANALEQIFEADEFLYFAARADRDKQIAWYAQCMTDANSLLKLAAPAQRTYLVAMDGDRSVKRNKTWHGARRQSACRSRPTITGLLGPTRLGVPCL